MLTSQQGKSMEPFDLNNFIIWKIIFVTFTHCLLTFKFLFKKIIYGPSVELYSILLNVRSSF